MMSRTRKIPDIKKYRNGNSLAENIGLPRKVAQRSVCGKMNHLASHCFTKTRGYVVESDSESELNEYCLTLRSVDESEVIRIHAASDQEYAKKLFVTINVGNTLAKFQLNSGATWNLIPAKFLRPKVQLFNFPRGNYSIMRPLETCTVAVSNRKKTKTYQIEFIVVDDD